MFPRKMILPSILSLVYWSLLMNVWRSNNGLLIMGPLFLWPVPPQGYWDRRGSEDGSDRRLSLAGAEMQACNVAPPCDSHPALMVGRPPQRVSCESMAETANELMMGRIGGLQLRNSNHTTRLHRCAACLGISYLRRLFDHSYLIYATL